VIKPEGDAVRESARLSLASVKLRTWAFEGTLGTGTPPSLSPVNSLGLAPADDSEVTMSVS
jgi:hypothetical protein